MRLILELVGGDGGPGRQGFGGGAGLDAQVLHLHDARAALHGAQEVGQLAQIHVREGQLHAALQDLPVADAHLALGRHVGHLEAGGRGLVGDVAQQAHVAGGELLFDRLPGLRRLVVAGGQLLHLLELGQLVLGAAPVARGAVGEGQQGDEQDEDQHGRACHRDQPPLAGAELVEPGARIGEELAKLVHVLALHGGLVGALHLDVQAEGDLGSVPRLLHLARAHFLEAAVALEGGGQRVDLLGAVRLSLEDDALQVDLDAVQFHRHLGGDALGHLCQQVDRRLLGQRRRGALHAPKQVERAVVVRLAGAEDALGGGAQQRVHLGFPSREHRVADHAAGDEQQEECGGEGGEQPHLVLHVVIVALEGELSPPEVEPGRFGAGGLAPKRQRVCLGHLGLGLGGHRRAGLVRQRQHAGRHVEFLADLLGEPLQARGATAQHHGPHLAPAARGERLEGGPQLSQERLEPSEKGPRGPLGVRPLRGGHAGHRPVHFFPVVGLRQRRLKLGGQRTAQILAAAREGAGELQPHPRPADGHRGALVADVHHGHRVHPLEPLERRGRLEEEVLVGDARVGDDARGDVQVGEQPQQRGQLLLAHHAHQHVAARLLLLPCHLVVEDDVGQVERQLALHLERQRCLDALRIGKGQGEGVSHQRWAGQGDDDLVRLERRVREQLLEGGLQRLVALTLGAAHLGVGLGGVSPHVRLEEHALHGVAAQVEA
ncbi:hypothetical protein STIAU_4525 [Stigmatella aurantiaca DW4/3-1]|uniref:Uncharacterized protein n=1 Tax=Stigmatella aurantiaca (strain DW4/3-1) TaxID=378806 RepID=Q08NC9_STIAD|nr:hypothetical protein STIAU_4525 [Stigmatella aurantiaca DW4/3-1]